MSGCSPSDRKTLLCPLDGNIIIYIQQVPILGIHAADARASAPLANNNVVLPLLYIGNIYYTSFYVVFFHTPSVKLAAVRRSARTRTVRNYTYKVLYVNIYNIITFTYNKYVYNVMFYRSDRAPLPVTRTVAIEASV